MHELHPFERQVAEDVVRRMGADRPVDDLAIFTTIKTQVPRRRFGSLFDATRFVAAGLIVALFGGFVLAAFLTTQQGDDRLPAGVASSPSSSPTQTPTGPDPVPSPKETDVRLRTPAATAALATIIAATPAAAFAADTPEVVSLDDYTFVVAQDGSGDHTTINDAVAAARKGDSIGVMPGVYPESVFIDKNITLDGTGAPEDVVIEYSDEAPLLPYRGYDDFLYGLVLHRTNATISDLTVRQAVPVGTPKTAPISPLFVRLGRPTIERVVVQDSEGRAYRGGGLTVTITGRAQLKDVEIDTHFELGGRATVEGSRLLCGVRMEGEQAQPTIRDSVIRNRDGECASDGGSINILSASKPKLIGNDISLQRFGIRMWDIGTAPVIRGNRLHDGATAIQVDLATRPTIRSNVFVDNETAIWTTKQYGVTNLYGDHGRIDRVDARTPDPIIEDNMISGGTTGIRLDDPATLTGNSIEGVSDRGISIVGAISPVLRGNRSCDNGTNLWLSTVTPASPDIDDSNDICPDESTE